MALGRDGLKIKRGDGRNHVEAGLTFKTHRLQSAQPSWATSLTPI
jgi:hypothetical protein